MARAILSAHAPRYFVLAIAFSNTALPAFAAESDAKHVLADSIASNLPDGLSDPGGVRARLAESGITFAATYYGEVFGNVSGGFRRDEHYHGLLDVSTNIDLQKLIGWDGLTFHANLYRPHGTSITLENTGTIAAISHIEATPSTKLFEAWFEQSLFAGKALLRFGQLAADAEFATLDSSASFISSTFGWNTLMTDNLPNGGPIFPMATPGVRLRVEPTDNFVTMVALYNGDPVGPCDGDPQLCNKHGTDFRLSDPPLVMAEAAYSYVAGLPGTIKIGGWHSFETFEDQRFDANGTSLADPSSTGIARRYTGNSGIYGVLYQMLYRVPDADDKGIHLFSRVAASPEDRNQIDFYAEGGLAFSGLVPHRSSDVFAIGMAYTHISDRAAGLDRDTNLFLGTDGPVRNYELLLELSYTAEIMTGWTVRPDFQYYWNPGGHVADPTDTTGTEPIANTAVFGLRSTATY